MKKIALPFLSLCTISFLNAQSPDFSWVKQIAGTGREVATSINLDASGNIYSSGYYEGSVDFDPSAASSTLTSFGTVSGYISKYDATGGLLWARSISSPVANTTFMVRITSQAVAPNGDICVTGEFDFVADFDPGPANALLNTPGSAANAFVAKYDAQGNYQWAKRLGGTKRNYSNSVALDANGNVYTTGFFIDTVDFDPGVATFTLASPPGNYPEIFVWKLDASGNFVWAKSMDIVAGDGGIGNDIITDASGNVYSTGSFMGTADFDPGAGTYTAASVMAEQDTYVWKLDGSGNFVWAKAMGGATKDGGISLALDANNKICLAGFFTGSGDFDPGAGTASLTSAGLNDIFYSKFDTQGNLLWTRSIGGTGNDSPSAIVTDANNNLYSTGYFENTVDFDPGVASYSFSAAAANIYISRLDDQGYFSWALHVTSQNYGGGSALVLGSGNSVFVTGTYSTTTDFDPNAGTYTITSQGNEDIFILKLLCGNPPPVLASSSNPTICTGGSATLSASGASTYTWGASGSNPFVVNPASSTTYTVIGQDANGCQGLASITQVVDACTELREASSEPAGLYPNPNNGELTIVSRGASFHADIVNVLGQTVISLDAEQSPLQVNTSGLPQGIYFVNVLHNGQLSSQLKMIKK